MRTESDNTILKKISEDILKTTELVQEQKKTREESETAVYDMLRDLLNRVKTEIENERKDR